MADAQVRSLPAFASALIAESPEKRTEALENTHAQYQANQKHWTLMLDAFEGTGGFADGSYLWPYRNERHEDHVKRQKMARYHNYVETIIDLYVRQVFTQEPARTSDNQELTEWWNDVDGQGTKMTDFLRSAISIALAAGHTGILMDMTRDEPVGPSKADQKARPFLVSYPATSITDWRTQRGEITGIKLLEAVPEGSISEEPEEDQQQYLLWDSEGWARFDADGNLLGADTPNLDLVPFDVLRPKPSILRSFIGRSLFSHGKIIQALFNRMSEEDEVLRNQAFSLLTCQVPEDGDVEQAKKALGEEMGTTSVLVAKGDIEYISPDMAVPDQVRQNILHLIREIYRVAHMRYERDSLQAESAEAIRLQFKELNEMLQGIASELQRIEMALARMFFHWTAPTPQAAEQQFEAANVSIVYTDEFFVADLILDLDAWAQAIAMDLGETMTKRIKKKAVRRIEPELTPEDAKKIDSEIDAQKAMPETAVQAAAGNLAAGAKSRLAELVSTTSAGSGKGA